MSSPIRVGFIGLSGNPDDKSSGTSWASTAHLPYLLSSPRYKLVALCNSSVASGQASLKAHNLPTDGSIATYGSPVDLANDPNVDLVVVSVNVAKHYETAKPALEAGKDVYVEWPLARNLKEAEELATIAKKSGSKTVVGLQGRFDPLNTFLRKAIYEEEKVGKVLSTTIVVDSIIFSGKDSMTLYYFLDPTSGGSTISIIFGHIIDTLQHLLSPITHFQSLLSNQRPTTIVHSPTDPNHIIDAAAPKPVPEHIALHGVLQSGAMLSATQRGGPPSFSDGTALRWRIYGEKGEIEVTSNFPAVQMGVEFSVKIKEFGKDDEEKVVLKAEGPAANVGRLYDAFAKVKDGVVKEADRKYADFEDAVRGHKLLDGMYAGKLGKEKHIFGQGDL